MSGVMLHMRDHLARLRARIQEVAREAGRADMPEILAVTKGVPVEKIRDALEAGLSRFGENRVQEAREKIPRIPEAEWHRVGHLQRNKVRWAVTLFHMIQSVDRPELVSALVRRLTRPMPVLIEANTSGEPQKHGVSSWEDLIILAETIQKEPLLELKGLMTVGPYPVEESRSRRAFATLRMWRDRLEERLGISLPVLSMGMSDDWIYAVMEGSTLLRLGRAIFGERR